MKYLFAIRLTRRLSVALLNLEPVSERAICLPLSVNKPINAIGQHSENNQNTRRLCPSREIYRRLWRFHKFMGQLVTKHVSTLVATVRIERQCADYRAL